VIASRKPALGKGLSALIPSARADVPGPALRAVAIDLLDANRRQPRRRFDDAGLEELSRSIKRTGILQPVLVTREGARFRILAGERRVRAALEDSSLSAGHARALLALPSAADQEQLAKEVVRRGLSVRATEARAAAIQKGSARKRKARAVDADTRDAELRLARALGTRVEIRRKGRGGEIRIRFFSEEELIGLFERFLGGRKT
jgi:ParB family chromosome partitioning protein